MTQSIENESDIYDRIGQGLAVLAFGGVVFYGSTLAFGAVSGLIPSQSKGLTKISGPDDPIAIAIGNAEGTRTCSGAKTKAYAKHSDPGDGKTNGGTFSAAPRGNGITNSMTPEERDAAFLVGINNALKSTDTSKMSKLEIANFVDLRVQAHPDVSAQFAKTTGPDIVSRRVRSFYFDGVNKSWTDAEGLKRDQKRRYDRISECLANKAARVTITSWFG